MQIKKLELALLLESPWSKVNSLVDINVKQHQHTATIYNITIYSCNCSCRI
jgi:hypothetical protein